MRVSLEWLNDYVDITGLQPAVIAEALTNSGLEVEGIETIGPRFQGVVIGRILAIEPHPNADRLRLVTVDIGADTPMKVVCGAPNVEENRVIAYAREGACVLSRKDNTLFTLEKAKIRGVESIGMICSLDELGLDTQYEKTGDGIWHLDAVLKAPVLGQDLKIALGLSGDTVLEVAPTANRGDLMSMRGVAREVAALFGKTMKPSALDALKPPATPMTVEIQLSDTSICGYYAGLRLSNLKVGASPAWLSQRLQAAGIRSISNVVDITNYVMLETGQPLHAFDLGKLGTAGIIDVRKAREDEQLTTLDAIDRPLSAESVLVTFNDAPVAMAGLMGGASTEMDDASTGVFLESAYFVPAAIRRSAKSVGLRSEASARFERGVDPQQCRVALLRAAELFVELAGGTIEDWRESSEPTVAAVTLPLTLAHFERWIGLPMTTEMVTPILHALGFAVAVQDSETLIVTVPSFRQDDVTREIDLIEEVIRIYGYDKVPYTLPQNTGIASITPRARFTRTLGEQLRAQGLQEVSTTSLIGPSLLEKTGFTLNADQLVSVLNSHSSEHTQMRQSLLPNLLEVAKFNQSQGADDVWIYELGRAYFKLGKPNFKNAGVSEKLYAAGLITGGTQTGVWHKAVADQGKPDFYVLKGIVENLLGGLRLDNNVSWHPASATPHLHPGKSAELKLSGKSVGTLGQLHPQIQNRLKFRQAVFVFELNVEMLLKAHKQTVTTPTFAKLSPFPAVARDMAVLLPNTVQHADIVAVLESVNDPLLKDVTLFDEYRSEQLGADRRSLAYRLTFRNQDATLTDADIDTHVTGLKDALKTKLPIEFR